ncbi:hypothetical protein DAPPUDRAFT_319711 [Daphnia pulex]|uniref:RRM domain-containing protein n=1 Tax=Daphnia pulex TaxID=6669 RepID=E9GMK4_DAPPU|nr:hypothetical protein DAPPUDRAFT_319711 [Daphnia pulex]|eukprot:EFX79114.1 hypothetical protein DAPPUDRAFT_319711 [Daphnia pulex]
MTAILFVQNGTPLHTSPITIAILREAFEVYGPIKKIIRRGKYPNGNIRAAKIYFESMENAEEARSHLDGKPLYGAYLTVSHGSKPPKSTLGNDVRVPSEQVAAVPVQVPNLQLSPARATNKEWNVALQVIGAVSVRYSSFPIRATTTGWKVSL